MLVMSPPAHNNILLGTAPHCSLFWCDFPIKPIPKRTAKPASKLAPKGKHLQLFKMRRKIRKSFYLLDSVGFWMFVVLGTLGWL